MTGTLPVAEIIDRTYQGEGPSRGQVATFVRLGGCNLACEWCDQPETWDGSRFDLRATITTRDVADVLGQVHRADAPLLVITGGEPLLYQRTSGFRALVTEAGRRVEIETNGTITPATWLNRQATLNVSPKLAHAGGDRARRIRPASLTALAYWARIGRAQWKFVVRDLADLDQVDALVQAAGKWVHMGRVNSLRRLRIADWFGCDSADGTFLAHGPDKNLPQLLDWLDRIVAERDQGELWTGILREDAAS